MAVNTSKTKYIIFSSHGKAVDPELCSIAMKLDRLLTMNLLNQLTEFIMMVLKKALSYSESTWTNISFLMLISHSFARKFLNPSFV